MSSCCSAVGGLDVIGTLDPGTLVAIDDAAERPSGEQASRVDIIATYAANRVMPQDELMKFRRIGGSRGSGWALFSPIASGLVQWA